MDSLSQLVLGAAVGELVLGKKIGNRALLWGGIAGTIPDFDVFSRPFLNIVEEVEFHRSISHSVLFFVLFAPLCAYFTHKWSKYKTSTSFKEWFWLFFLCFFTHSLLDCFTTWGTQLFWPHPARIAWNSVFVVDPIYTLPYLGVLIRIAFLKKDSLQRYRLNLTGIGITTSYLLMTLGIKGIVNSKFKAFVKEDKIEYTNLDSRPCPFQTVLWTANVEDKDNFYIYYYSFLDKERQAPTVVAKNHYLLAPYLKDERVQKLLEISKHYYTVETTEKGVRLNDLRFGQYDGWENKDAPFVFAYHIYQNGAAIQIDEVEKDNKKAMQLFGSLWKRIAGI